MFKFMNKNNLIKILVVSLLVTGFSLSGCKKKDEDTMLSSKISINKKVEEDQIERPDLRANFEKAKKQNSDTVAWINIPGTTIDYPVVQDLQNRGQGNEDYYIHRNFEGKQVAVGKESAIMSDKRNVISPIEKL